MLAAELKREEYDLLAHDLRRLSDRFGIFVFLGVLETQMADWARTLRNCAIDEDGEGEEYRRQYAEEHDHMAFIHQEIRRAVFAIEKRLR